MCILNTFPPSLPRTLLACFALSHPTAIQALVHRIPEQADMLWCCGITMQNACTIRSWLVAKCRSMMFVQIQGVGFPDGSAVVEQHSMDGISALIIHNLDRINAFIIHMWVHSILRKTCIFTVYSATVQHFIKLNVTELNMQPHNHFKLFSGCLYYVGGWKQSDLLYYQGKGHVSVGFRSFGVCVCWWWIRYDQMKLLLNITKCLKKLPCHTFDFFFYFNHVLIWRPKLK